MHLIFWTTYAEELLFNHKLDHSIFEEIYTMTICGLEWNDCLLYP